MSKRDLLRPYMDIIDKMVAQMVRNKLLILFIVESKTLQLETITCDFMYISAAG